MCADVVASRSRMRVLVGALIAVGALALPSAAQAAPLTNVHVAFGFPVPTADTIAGDETEYTISFTAGASGMNSTPGTAIIVNAAGAPPFAAGTIFPPNALHEDGGAFYTVGTAADPANIVVADVIRMNGNQTVIIPTAFTGVTAAAGTTITVTIGYLSEGKVQNRATACNDCVIAVDTNLAGDDFGLSNTFDVNVGPGDLLVEAGDDQTTTVGTAFGNVLKAKLIDGLGAPVQGETITFAAPASGPSGTFADGGGLTDDATTDANGIATSSVLTANEAAGVWTAGASSSVAGVNTVDYSLENVADVPDAVTLGLDPTAIPGDGVSTSEATATVTDQFGNPTSNQTVTITSDGDQDITPTQAEAGGIYHATITATPESGLFTITAAVAEGSAPTDTAGLAQTLDSTAPIAKILKHPRKRSTRRRARFTFDSNAGDTDFFECKLDGGGFHKCESPKGYAVSRGKHTFKVRATDFAGNTGPADVFKFTRIRKR
jgi:hypothetical protein